MTPETLTAAHRHALDAYPSECCGLVVVVRGRERYWPCRNLADKPGEHFIMSPEDYAAADDAGEVTAVVHSHPRAAARASEADLVQCENTGLPWAIISVMADGDEPPMVADTAMIEPSGYEAPLVGRNFHHGILDCWSLCRDWYKREWALDLPNRERRDAWWDDGQSDLYRDNLGAAGFAPVRIEDMRAGDMILMEIESRNRVPNHAAIYLGDGQILHHLPRRLSSRDVYGGYWREKTRMVVRHRHAR